MNRRAEDLDNLFDREEAERLRAERADMIENGKRREAMLNAQDAVVKANARASMLKASEVAIIREYQHAGVEPLRTTGAGVPTCSLALLLRMGWRIEDTPDGRTLVAPPPLPKWDGRQDWDSLPKKGKN